VKNCINEGSAKGEKNTNYVLATYVLAIAASIGIKKLDHIP